MGSLDEAAKAPWEKSGLGHSAGPSRRCFSRDLPRAGGRVMSGGEHPPPANSNGSLLSMSSQRRSSLGGLPRSELANKLDPSRVDEESKELSVKSKGGFIELSDS